MPNQPEPVDKQLTIILLSDLGTSLKDQPQHEDIITAVESTFRITGKGVKVAGLTNRAHCDSRGIMLGSAGVESTPKAEHRPRLLPGHDFILIGFFGNRRGGRGEYRQSADAVRIIFGCGMSIGNPILVAVASVQPYHVRRTEIHPAPE